MDSDYLGRIFSIANAAKGSTMWNLLWESRFIITEHLSRQVRNGQKAKFWDDSWDGGKPIREMFEDQNWVNNVANEMGDRVDQYFEGGGVREKRLSGSI